MGKNGNTPTVTRIEIRTDQERAYDVVTVDEWIAFEDGKMSGAIALITGLMWNEETNTYYDPAEARKIVGKLTITQLNKLASETRQAITDMAVPPKSEGASESD